MTQAQIKRLSQMFKKFAKEEVTVKYIGGAVYAFCSEIAMLRIAAIYKNANGTSKGFSNPYNSHFFCIEEVTAR